MTRPASHDGAQLVREAESQSPGRFTSLQPYVPGQRTCAPATSAANRRGHHNVRLPAEPRSVADLCERLASAAEAAEAAELLAGALADVLAVDRAIVVLDAHHLARTANPAPNDASWIGAPGICMRISRPRWPLSTTAEWQVHAAQTLIRVGDVRFGWVRIERVAHRIEADELGSLRIVATALGQRLATFRALEAAASRGIREDGPDAPNRLGG